MAQAACSRTSSLFEASKLHFYFIPFLLNQNAFYFIKNTIKTNWKRKKIKKGGWSTWWRWVQRLSRWWRGCVPKCPRRCWSTPTRLRTAAIDCRSMREIEPTEEPHLLQWLVGSVGSFQYSIYVGIAALPWVPRWDRWSKPTQCIARWFAVTRSSATAKNYQQKSTIRKKVGRQRRYLNRILLQHLNSGFFIFYFLFFIILFFPFW